MTLPTKGFPPPRVVSKATPTLPPSCIGLGLLGASYHIASMLVVTMSPGFHQSAIGAMETASKDFNHL